MFPTFSFQYDVARRVSKSHMSAKFHCSVGGLRESNSKKKKMKNCSRIGIFYLTPFPCTNLHVFWSVG